MNHWIQPGTLTANFAATATRVPITVAAGDGIGPEIMAASLRVLEAAGAALDIETVEVGETLYRAGHSSGISGDTWDSLRRTGVFFKGPITTPQGGGYKSLNVTIRKTLGLYANVRPVQAYSPYVPSAHPGMDVVIVRENEEDLYAGVEHQQTADVVQCLKLITRPGCERIARHAFEYARQNGRRHVTCMTKDNIMKLTDGLFRRVVEEVRQDYPEIGYDHMIVDIGMARLARAPERFDVVVLPNLYGDILSDIAAEISGSVGLAPSVNQGERCAMFEAIHGSAPDIAGKGVANPSGLLLAGAMMLDHIGQSAPALRIRNAWRLTLEEGIHTADIASDGHTRQRVGTDAFADAVIARLGERPRTLPSVSAPAPAAAPAKAPAQASAPKAPRPEPVRTLVGVDVFVCSRQLPDALAQAIGNALASQALALVLITNRGVKVWPNGLPETYCTDHWRCRLMPLNGERATANRLLDAQRLLLSAGLEIVKTENLYEIDGGQAFSLGQGQ